MHASGNRCKAAKTCKRLKAKNVSWNQTRDLDLLPNDKKGCLKRSWPVVFSNRKQCTRGRGPIGFTTLALNFYTKSYQAKKFHSFRD